MAAFHTVCASAQGLTAPERSADDNAPVARGVVEVQGTVSSPDSAAKMAATATARAALLGIEVRELQGGAWLLQHASGSPIGTVKGLEGLRAAVDGFHAARDDVADLVRRIGARGSVPSGPSDDRGRVLALTERLQRAGWTLTRSEADDGPAAFTVSRWGMARTLATLADVREFAYRVGVAL